VPDWELRDPLFLVTGILAPLIYLLARSDRSAVTYSSLDVPDRAPVSARARLAHAPSLLLALAGLLLAIALAGPRTGDATTEVVREGIAIALVVDRSGSMDARDFVERDTGVSRLHAVKQIVRDFVLGGRELGGRGDDLIGLVAFAGYADAFCPLTLDHLNLVAILDRIEINADRREAGTAIGEGVALAVERLRRHPAKSKVIILLTDGVNNAGAIEPLQAAELAAQHDIRVYAIGAGRSGLAPVPVRTGDGRVRLQRMRVELDEGTLRSIAERTDGRYFHAESVEALESVYAEIDRLERSKIFEVRYLQYTEHYQVWTLAALACIGLAGASGGTLLRRLP
jgi:Ca-activated chloride channel family protein